MAVATYFTDKNWRKLAVIALLGSIVLLALLVIPGLGCSGWWRHALLRLPGLLTVQPACGC